MFGGYWKLGDRAYKICSAALFSFGVYFFSTSTKWFFLKCVEVDKQRQKEAATGKEN